MDVYTVARACVRRWYVLVPLLVLASVVSIVQVQRASAQYTQTAQLLVGNSAVAVAGTAGPGQTVAVNPLPNSTTALTVLVARLNTAEVLAANAVGTAVVSAAVDPKSPILILTSSGTSASDVARSLAAGLASAPSQLTSLQDALKAPSTGRYEATPIAVDPSAATSYPSRTRSVVITTIVGFIVALLLTEIVDALLQRRRGRRTTDDATEPESTTTAELDALIANALEEPPFSSVAGRSVAARSRVYGYVAPSAEGSAPITPRGHAARTNQRRYRRGTASGVDS